MNASAQYEIGAKVDCQGEPCGRLVRVVLDPVARRLTHLVVDPRHGLGGMRLVPLDLVDADDSDAQEIRLNCDSDAFEALDAAQETEFLPGEERLGYQADQTITWPYYGLGVGSMGLVGVGDPAMMSPLEAGPVLHDRVPAGETQIRRGDPVEALDGEIGHVQGLVVDPRDQAVTHVLLQEGHLWGRKTVAIPIGSVTCADDGVRTGLSKQQLGELPPVDFDEHS